MEPHSPEHELLIEQLLVGDLPPTDPRARALRDGCAACRARIEELERLSGTLSAVGAEERAVLAEVEKGRISAAEEQRLREIVLAHAPRPRRSRVLPWVIGALAAAAAIVVVFVWRSSSGDGSRSGGETYLGDPDRALRGLEPRGSVREYGTFRWSSPELPPEGSYTLRIWSEADPSAPPIFIKKHLPKPEWTPTPAELEKLPRKLRWQVEMYDGSNVERAHSEPLSASLP